MFGNGEPKTSHFDAGHLAGLAMMGILLSGLVIATASYMILHIDDFCTAWALLKKKTKIGNRFVIGLIELQLHSICWLNGCGCRKGRNSTFTQIFHSGNVPQRIEGNRNGHALPTSP